MKTCVISLTSATARRANIVAQFTNHQVSFDFFDAVTPSDVLQHIKRVDIPEFVLNCGRPPLETELACYASHLALWRECASGDVPYVIIEDDAQLGESFRDGYQVVRHTISSLGFLRLSIPNTTSNSADHEPELVFCSKVPLLSLAYALTPKAAQRLVEASATVEQPVDKFLQQYWRHQELIYAISPPVVSLSEHADVSDIGVRRRPIPSLGLRLRRVFRRSTNSIVRKTYSLAAKRRAARSLARAEQALRHCL